MSICVDVNLRCNGILYSKVFSNFLGNHANLVSKLTSVIEKLICDYNFDSFGYLNGLWISADKPFGKNTTLSNKRCAVLRNYFGLNIQQFESPWVSRVTYGTGSGANSVGTPKW